MIIKNMKKYKLKRILYLIMYSLKWMCLYLSISTLGLLLIPLLIELFGRLIGDKSIFGNYLTTTVIIIGIVFTLGIIFSILEKIIKKSGNR